jgi:TRAP transporter TAXI family solute receptor
MPESRRPWLSKRMLFATAAIFLAALAVSFWWIGEPPPRQIRLATGDPQGGFAVLGARYKARLESMGLKVELIGSNGSLENLDLLRSRHADVAFVQGGTAAADETKVSGLASVCAEPLWIFSRKPVATLRDLKGQRVTVGPAVSGTDVLARQLLKEHGVTEENTALLNRTMAQARQAIHDDSADAVLLVCAPEAPVVRDLVQIKGVRLVSLRHQQAIARRLPYLRPVTVPEGALDLRKDLPAQDTALVAPVTILAARHDLHPRVVEQLLVVARAIHGGGDLLEERGRYPSLDGVDLPVHITAEKFMKAGESFLSRWLPYSAMRLIWQVQLLALPLLALVPLWKAVPLLYSFRINQILKHHYVALGEVEAKINTCADAAELERLMGELEGLRTELEAMSRKVPAHLQRDIYHWRLHVAMVRDEAQERLRQLHGEPAPATTEDY